MFLPSPFQKNLNYTNSTVSEYFLFKYFTSQKHQFTHHATFNFVEFRKLKYIVDKNCLRQSLFRILNAEQ